MRSSLFLVLVLVTACSATPPLIETKTVYVVPPDSLYVCPDMADADYVDAMQSDAARLLVKLAQRGDTCRNSLDAIRAYSDQARTGK